MSIYKVQKRMGNSREKREEAHTHTHTFPSSLCSQFKTQETLFLLYIFYALSYIRSTRSTKVNKQNTFFLNL